MKPGRWTSPDHIVRVLGLDLEAAKKKAPRQSTGSFSEPDLTVKVSSRLKHHNKVAQARWSPLPGGSRFRALNRLVANCVEVGMTRDQVHVVCSDYEPAVDKFSADGRLHEQIDICWEKTLYKKLAEGWEIAGDIEDGTAVLLPKASGRPPQMDADDLAFDESDVIEGNPLPSTLRFDFAAMADGSFEPTLPTMLARNDGKFLLYPGLTHWLYGRAGAGKSFVALFAVVEALKAGQEVLYLDYEMSPRRVWDVLVNVLGVEPAVVQKQFIYHKVEGSFGSSLAYDALLESLLAEASGAALAVVDGVNKSIQQENWNPNENGDVNRWFDLLPNRIVKRTGAAVVCIDHANQQGKLLGSVAKAAGVTGAIYKLDVHKGHVLGKGRTGVLNLEVEKDREGGIIEIAETHYVRHTYSYHDMVARITVKSDQSGRIEYDIAPHPAQNGSSRPTDQAEPGQGASVIGPQKLQAASEFFATHSKEWFSKRKATESEFFKGSQKDRNAVIEELARLGCLEEGPGRGGKPTYRFLKAYVPDVRDTKIDFGSLADDEDLEADDYDEDL